MSNQSELNVDVCKAASKPYFRMNTATPNDSSDATDSKGMSPNYAGITLSTRTKLEGSGCIVGFPLTTERSDRTDGRNGGSSDLRAARLDPICKVYPADGFFSM